MAAPILKTWETGAPIDLTDTQERAFMLKREDSPNELKTLGKVLRRIKPEGWSVVFGVAEIIVRPKDRTTGKFSIYLLTDEICRVGFFSRQLNYWNKCRYFKPDVSLAASLKEWMESAAAEPLE
jgi:hypothetical protein